ncbi:hypothetical protein MXB_4778 [Myxobolus squamalis]|nr:hypothetical protein MXB_4778 [Myxobolus squamalis]
MKVTWDIQELDIGTNTWVFLSKTSFVSSMSTYTKLVEDYLLSHQIGDEIYSATTLASGLKLFLRKLSEPLLTFDYRGLFLEAAKIGDKETLKQLIEALPVPHRDTLSYVMIHLQKMALKSPDTKMDIQNFAIAFGPTLYGDDSSLDMSTAAILSKVNLELLSIETSFYEYMLRSTIEKELFVRIKISDPVNITLSHP